MPRRSDNEIPFCNKSIHKRVDVIYDGQKIRSWRRMCRVETTTDFRFRASQLISVPVLNMLALYLIILGYLAPILRSIFMGTQGEPVS